MGCGTSFLGRNELRKSDSVEYKKSTARSSSNFQPSIKAAILIQNWYRRYMARLEARRRCSWSIYQSIEYEGEQDHLKLYNFFNDLLVHVNTDQLQKEFGSLASALGQRLSKTRGPSLDVEDEDLLAATDPSHIKIESSYRGPHLTFPLSSAQIEMLIDAFRNKQKLHAHYVLELLHETRKALRKCGTVNHASTSIAGQITVCGDLHGKFEDLCLIFYKNGLPAVSNPYVFNGDFVDRGQNSLEVAIVLFACFLLHPNEVCLNRGNHEDHIMNLRYGFVKEVMNKYTDNASKIIRLFEDIFSWLPLATVIDGKILVCHGGISTRTDIKKLGKVDRHKFISVLQPPLGDEDSDADEDSIVDFNDWRQVLDILWSDPRVKKGCSPNTFRGGGSYFGPDVTKQILQKHGYQLLIRSHECKIDGYEFMHDNQVLTVFSASNYYEYGSNKGAYVKLGTDLKPHLVQFQSSKAQTRKLTITQRVSLVESSAMRDLRSKLIALKSELIEAFKKFDPSNTGSISVNDWCHAVEFVTQLGLPWRTLRPQIVKLNKDGSVSYLSSFENFKLKNKYTEKGQTVTEVLYRNRNSLEMIFRAIDKDNSGQISMEEFADACKILSRHIRTPISASYVEDMAKSIDMNNDGHIDFNEFLEAFRLVDNEHRNSLESPLKIVEEDDCNGIS
ncbi:serine/threonine-protein phosphatase with EF-hands pef-1-like isoform X2 [Tubulanus polymorphus]|uniref:serine/threonine-protein phosphatase with EF-hands pef-1-like isoform X2 n=1 Tax=Tubulanus polymorphus TaxID=672921 RepID=UPI003DA32ABD